MIRYLVLLTIVFSLTFVAGCESPKEAKEINKQKVMMQKFNNTLLSDWLDLRITQLNDFPKEEAIIVENVQYEGLKNLTRANLQTGVSMYYFFDKEENCVMIYINDKTTLASISVEEIKNQYGAPQEILRSRSGKRASQWVFSENGFAFSITNNTIAFLEIFPNCNADIYKQNIYKEPPKFRK